MKSIIVLIFFISYFNLSSQIQSVNYVEDGISILCNLVKIHRENKNIHLEFKYQIKNNSKNDIFIIDLTDSNFIHSVDTIPIENYIIELGGGFSFFPKFRVIPPFIKIKKQDSYSNFLNLIISDSIGNYHEFISREYFDKKDYRIILISVFLGYYNNPDNKIINRYITKLSNYNNQKYELFDINIDKDLFGFTFDKFYKRKLCVFPIALSDIK